MKRVFLFFALFAALAVSAQQVDKQTFIYSIKGTDTLRLDRYTATPVATAQLAATNARPCLMFVFGGGFVAGERDKAHYMPYFEYYAQQGYTVVSIDYRLGLKKAIDAGTLNEKTFPMAFIGTLTMAVEDLYDATAYVCSKAGEWGVDPRLIVASGSSAGAITVLMGEYGICNDNQLAQKLPAGFNYAGVISYAGAIFDLADELTWAKAPAPIMLFHGDADRNVVYDVVRYEGAGFFGSKYIAQQLTRKRLPHWFYSVTNTDHAMATRPMNENRYEIDAFLSKLVLGHQPLIINTDVTPLDAPDLPKEFKLMDYIQSNFGQ